MVVETDRGFERYERGKQKDVYWSGVRSGQIGHDRDPERSCIVTSLALSNDDVRYTCGFISPSALIKVSVGQRTGVLSYEAVDELRAATHTRDRYGGQ